MKKLSLLVCILLIWVAPSYAQFQFTSIDYPGANGTAAFGINKDGDIVGSYRISPPAHALLIRGGRFIPLAPDTILGTNFSQARKINNNGDVVGFFGGDDGFIHGFLLKDKVLTTLDFPGASDTYAIGINKADTIVGFWDLLDADGNVLVVHGFTWQNGTFAQFDFPGAADTSVSGINDRGDLVGGWDTGITSPNESGFVCSMGQCTSFDVPVAGATVTQADDINAKGKIVGVYTDSNGVPHGFLLVGSNFSSFDFPGAIFTVAWGINSAGRIVGNYHNADGSGHGFLAVPQ